MAKQFLDSAGVGALWKVIKQNFAGPNALPADSLQVGKDITYDRVNGEKTETVTIIKSSDSVSSALSTVVASINAGGAGSVITIDTDTTTEGYLKTYSIKQGGTVVGKIDIPLDKVLTNAAMVYGTSGAGSSFTEQDPSDEDGEWNLRLTFANSDTVYIPVAAFIESGEFYKGSTGDGINVEINQNTRVISASLASNFKLSESQLPDTISASKVSGTLSADNIPIIPSSKVSGITSAQVSHSIAGTPMNTITGYADKVNTVQKAVNVILENSHTVASNGGIFHKVELSGTANPSITFTAYNTETEQNTTSTISFSGTGGTTVSASNGVVTINSEVPETTSGLAEADIKAAIKAVDTTALGVTE